MLGPGTREQGTRLGGSPALCCEELSFRYPGADSPALDGVSFSVLPGEHVGVVGPNGGGKSALVRLLNGLLAPGPGEVRVAGYDPVTQTREARRRIGILFQNPDNGLVAPFVEDDVAFGLENLGVERGEMRERVRRAIESVDLSGYERRDVSTLSGGEKQRVALAGILAVEPEVLALDEPTSMLDAAGRHEILARTRALRRRRTVLHVTHHLDELLEADRILVLAGGRLLAELAPDELMADAALLDKARLTPPAVQRLAVDLGLDASLTPNPERLAKEILRRLEAR